MENSVSLEVFRIVGLVASTTAHVAYERVSRRTSADPAWVPPAADRITPEWLTAVLCGSVPDAVVETVRVTDGSDGTSSRRRIAVGYNAAGLAAGLPASVFTKSTATLSSRLLLGITGIVRGETDFYSKVRPDLSLRSPGAYYASFDPRSHRSMVLLEDLSPGGWTFPDPQQNPISKADACDMVDEIATYHAALWASPRFSADLSGIAEAWAWQEGLNRKVGFQRRTLTGFDRARAVIPDRLYARRDKLFPAFMKSLALHRLSPQTLLHQDLHPGNWLRDPDGRMGLYDWQCVAVGHGASDLSYALGACLETEDRREWQEELVNRYSERLIEAGANGAPTFDEAWLAYRQQSLHGFAMGLFTNGGSRFEPELQPPDYTVAAIGRLARHVDDLGTLDVL